MRKLPELFDARGTRQGLKYRAERRQKREEEEVGRKAEQPALFQF
jgi:hypothetical protein